MLNQSNNITEKVELQDIKNDLPNFPDEVITDWLLPIANDIGWPPVTSRWNFILLDKPLDFWKTLTWEKKKSNLDKMTYTNDALAIYYGLKDAYLFDKDNMYWKDLGFKGRNKYFKALRHIFKYGTFPKPICLLKEISGYMIVDGCHRFTAWKTSPLFIEVEEMAKTPEELKRAKAIKEKILNETGASFIATFSPIQEVWVAE